MGAPSICRWQKPFLVGVSFVGPFFFWRIVLWRLGAGAILFGAVNWDLSVSLGKGILQKINHKPVGESLGPPEDKG